MTLAVEDAIAIAASRGAQSVQLEGFRSPRSKAQMFMNIRPDTVDHDICAASLTEDEYGLADLPDLTGLAIDVGSYIGSVAIALALDHPELHVKAIEVVPENVKAIQDNIALNHVEGRVEVIYAAAGGPDELSRTCYMRHRSHPQATEAYVNKHRFVGNSFWSPKSNLKFEADAVDMDVVSLSDLSGGGPVSFIKIDAEGAEWEFLADPAIAHVERIIGEYHWDYLWQGDASVKKPGAAKRVKRRGSPQGEMMRLLADTHRVTIAEHPTIGHFEGSKR